MISSILNIIFNGDIVKQIAIQLLQKVVESNDSGIKNEDVEKIVSTIAKSKLNNLDNFDVTSLVKKIM